MKHTGSHLRNVLNKERVMKSFAKLNSSRNKKAFKSKRDQLKSSTHTHEVRMSKLIYALSQKLGGQ